jgi:hypothetical protein
LDAVEGGLKFILEVGELLTTEAIDYSSFAGIHINLFLELTNLNVFNSQVLVEVDWAFYIGVWCTLV